MSQLLSLSRHLADGTSGQKRRAWRRLAWEGALWQDVCRLAMSPDGADVLERSWWHLSDDWDRSPLLDLAGRTEREVTFVIESACSLVATARLASLCAFAPRDVDAANLWLSRAVGFPGRPVVSGWPETVSRGVIRLVLRRWVSESLAAPQAADRVNEALSALLLVGRGGGPDLPGVEVPLLLTTRDGGSLAWLRLSCRAEGEQALAPMPPSWLMPIGPELRAALERAWTLALGKTQRKMGIAWGIDSLPRNRHAEPLPIDGTSAGAAAALGMVCALLGRPHPAGFAASAALDPDGVFLPVGGFGEAAEKFSAAALLLENGEPLRLLVSDQQQVSADRRAHWARRGIEIESASCLDAALAVLTDGAESTTQSANGRVRRGSARGGLAPAASGAACALLAPRLRQRIALIYALEDAAQAAELASALQSYGFRADAGQEFRSGFHWAIQRVRQLLQADVAVVLVTPAFGDSEMALELLREARESCLRTGVPRLIAVQTDRAASPPEVATGILAGIEGLPAGGGAAGAAERIAAAIQSSPPVAESGAAIEPAPPAGALPAASSVYIHRACDAEFAAALERGDSIVRVRGARQTGKSSLLIRGIQREHLRGASVLFTDLRSLNEQHLSSIERFFITMGRWMARELALPADPEDRWDPREGPSSNFQAFLLDEILERLRVPFVWVMDEVDRLFSRDYAGDVFGLVRSWHNRRSYHAGEPWTRLTVALAYSTDAQFYLGDLTQSPFNVGTRIVMEDFSLPELEELNRRYGSPLAAPSQVREFYDLLGGHPFLSHRAIHEMARRSLSLPELKRELGAAGSFFADHLHRMLLSISGIRGGREAVLSVMELGSCRDPETFDRLWAAGILSGSGPSTCRIRCRVYEDFLRERLK